MDPEMLKAYQLSVKELDQHKRMIEAAREPLNSALSALGGISAIENIMRDVERDRLLMRAAIGPLDDLRRLTDIISEDPSAKWIADAAQEYNRHFAIPSVTDAMRLLSETQPHHSFFGDAKHIADLERSMRSLASPWANELDLTASINSFANLYSIGETLKRVTTYDQEATEILRSQLGDWRAEILWTEPVLTDIGERSAFYASLGFNSGLTDFPAPAFTEILRATDIDSAVVVIDRNVIPRSKNDGQEQGFVRTNKAHNTLMRLEIKLRHFIHARMSETYGSNWPKHRLPNGMLDEWLDKRRKAAAAETDDVLINYADFTDYEHIICRQDNWKSIFSTFFSRPESVRETFNRLHPVRINTMHARLITQDDELILIVEAKRLLKSIQE